MFFSNEHDMSISHMAIFVYMATQHLICVLLANRAKYYELFVHEILSFLHQDFLQRLHSKVDEPVMQDTAGEVGTSS